MTLPTVTVQIAFQEDPAAVPVWTDVTAYVKSVNTGRGKARVLDNMQAGRMTVVLDNADARFDPNNTLSPYAPYVLPLRPMRVFASFGGTDYGIFRGFVQSFTLGFQGPNVATATVTVTDGFEVLNLAKVTASYSQELSGTRIANLLDSAGWPAALRDIDPGQTTVQARSLDGESVLSDLLKTAESENGLFFIDADGNARFIDRHSLISDTVDTANYTFGNTAGEKPLAEGTITAPYDTVDLFNEVNVSSQGVATQTASDSASQTKYFTRVLDRSALLLTSESEQLDYARYTLSAFAEPAQRIEKIEPLGSHGGTDYWARILDRDLASKVRVNHDPPGAGDTIQQDSYVEGITYDITDGARVWRVTWDLVPLDRRTEFWVAGDAQLSKAGQTTRAAY